MDIMKYDTLDKCNRAIGRLSAQILQLQCHKQRICEHNIIKFEGFVDDDYAHTCNQLWTHYMTCQDCGLQGKSEEQWTASRTKKETVKNKEYMLLEALYDKTDWRDKQYVCDHDRQHSWQIAYRKGKPNGKST